MTSLNTDWTPERAPLTFTATGYGWRATFADGDFAGEIKIVSRAGWNAGTAWRFCAVDQSLGHPRHTIDAAKYDALAWNADQQVAP